jgi:two-component system CheB/CheR fusion protein
MRGKSKKGDPKERRNKDSNIKKTRTKETANNKKKALLSPGAKRRDNSFHVVGMSASAGGLEAFEQFFKNMPADSGMAFILVPHLDPTHKSIMVDLIKRCTGMGVMEAKDGVRIHPNTIYVIPPNYDLSVLHERLHLMEPLAPRGQRHPIDYFLRSLAEDRGEKAIGIVLSGTGTDGTVGLKAIKGSDGMVMVQDPISAKYDGMPRSAIDTGLVDYVLPPEKMPEALIKYVRYSNVRVVRKDSEIAAKIPDSLQKILILLRNQTGHDFSLYKKNTILRRIERRMSVHQVDKLSDYLRYMQEHFHEINLLFKEIIIGVTNFFRDKEAFDVLKAKVFPHLLKGRSPEDNIRIWVVGCSTGEEAYSIAITLREYIVREGLDVKVQVFATDIDEDAIERARQGIYPESIAVDVSLERLKRFFAKRGNTYHIKKEIREMVVFASQDVIKDPPFSKLDLISCRNLLIYFDSELQKKILPLFHYTLKPSGILFLGPSETIGGFTDLFDTFDKKWRFFKRKEMLASGHSVAEFPGPPVTYHAPESAVEVKKIDKVVGLSDIIEKMLLDKYAPPCVIIDQKCDILYIHGRTGKYLEPSSGIPHMNIISMAREGLKTPLERAIRKYLSQKSEMVVQNVRVKTNGGHQLINLFVKPVPFFTLNNGLAMIILEDVKPIIEDDEENKGKTLGDRDARKRLLELEQELKYTKESLQTTIEELETANEELKSTNEELQSSNEELQSTNEELETAKEETQSLNEELMTVNSELQGKIDELTEVNNDMKNLLDSIQIATIFLDNNLKIKRFTPNAAKLINLISSDVGRPIVHIATNLVYENLVDDVKSVLKSLVFVEKEVQTKDGNWYLIRIMPYRTTDNVIDGVVITLVDIDDLKKNRHEALEARLYADGIVNTVREPLLVLDKYLRVVSANESFYRNFQVTKEQTEKKLIYEIGNAQWNIPALRQLLEDIIPNSTCFNNFKVVHEFEKVGLRTMLLNARLIDFAGQRENLILLAIEDISERNLV